MNTPSDSSIAAAAPLPADLLRLPARALLQWLLRRVQRGSLAIELPGGERLQARGAEAGPEAVLHLHRWRALRRLLTQGDLGLALSYRDGDWYSPDLTALLMLGAANDEAWGSLMDGRGPWRALTRLWHRAHANTRRGSRHNIAFHYDLGNAFYAQWLDPSMLYSSALFSQADASLEEAQAAKLEAILQSLETPPRARVLEVGIGWGTLAATLAQRHEAQVTGLTLSREQLAHARQLGEQLGVASRLDLRLQDYRDVQGRFERIVSIEMLEAVGEAYWPEYFAMLRERLAPGGQAVLQVITIGERWFPRYRRGADFIQRCVFPGGMLPTRAALRERAQEAGLALEEGLHFGASYALTLAAWRRRFLAAWPGIAPLGFDERFRRLWEYYLCYCEAGFRTGRIDVGLYRLRHR